MEDRSWVDRNLYPFESKWYDVDHKTVHYIDEGQGEPVVFLHGMPTWSFMYRDIIKGLRSHFRCIALDNVGFGLSSKPSTYTYRPEKMAEYLSEFIRDRQLKDVTLVVNGTGGPIGLHYALEHPQNVRHIVLLNTFMWPLKGNPQAEKIARLPDSPLSRWLQIKLNFAVKVGFKSRLKDRSHYSPKIQQHYLMPFDAPEKRHGPLGYAKSLTASGPWFQQLWDRREALKSIPSMMLWGMKDDVFGEPAIQKWLEVWPEAKVRRFKNNGHYLAEEQGAGLVPELILFLTDTDYLPTSTVEV
jgi:pimeloyl-ACP methyl ester carboxylesterase